MCFFVGLENQALPAKGAHFIFLLNVTIKRRKQKYKVEIWAIQFFKKSLKILLLMENVLKTPELKMMHDIIVCYENTK